MKKIHTIKNDKIDYLIIYKFHILIPIIKK